MRLVSDTCPQVSTNYNTPALVFMACAISMTYLVEIEAICLIDQFSGDRARLIQESLQAERELADLLGMEPPTTVDDPKCVNNTGGWIVLLVGLAIMVFLSYNIKVWGLPLVLVAILIAAYTIGTVLVWYFHGPEDINKYLMTKLAGEPRMLADGRPRPRPQAAAVAATVAASPLTSRVASPLTPCVAIPLTNSFFTPPLTSRLT